MSESLRNPIPPPNVRLLIVDDEPHIRSALVRALEILKYTVAEAACGAEALEKLQQDPYDLMILDLYMPGMDGVEVMQQARLRYPELLIVVLTGHATVESAITAVKLDAVDYLRKPADLQEIVATINQALQKRARQRHQQHLMDIMANALEALRHSERIPSQVPEINAPTESHLLRVWPLTLDVQKMSVTIEADPQRVIELTEGEVTVLRILMSYPDRVLSCQEMVSFGWGYEIDECEAEGLIRPYIFRLRRKVEVDPKRPHWIQTVRSRGYIFSSANDDTASKTPVEKFLDFYLNPILPFDQKLFLPTLAK